MSREEIQQSQQEELENKLWSIANTLRGNMDANDFKNYILGLIFYKFLSENIVEYVEHTLLRNQKYETMFVGNIEKVNDFKEDLIEDENLGYYIEPEFLWKNLIGKIKTGKFDISLLAKAINALSDSTLGSESEDDFENLFEDMDLSNSKLGKGESDKTKLISTVMLKIDDIEFKYSEAEIDILGNAYEYLISNFAASAGKKAGEFYTPQQVSKILAKIVSYNKSKIQTVYDPTCGSGSLLLRVGKETKVTSYYGQEFNSTTYNLARMNMLLHGVSFKHFDIKNDDTLEKPRHLDKGVFDAIVANPPYSANWSANSKFLEDERFSAYGKLAPKSRADYAFVQHMLYQLADNGTMAVVLPHGVLFRGASEGSIREYIIKEKNYLDAVIGLPANIFYGTPIPTCILVFKKCREENNNIFFIDASSEYDSSGTKNVLRDEDVNKIIETYINRIEIEKYSKIVSLETIKENDYNLNIPRYVDTYEEEDPVNIDEVNNNIKNINKELININLELNKYLDKLKIEEL